MDLRVFTAAMIAAGSLSACAMPAPQTASAAPAVHRHYVDPNTGSLLSGGDTSNLGSGENDPSMGMQNQAAGGR